MVRPRRAGLFKGYGKWKTIKNFSSRADLSRMCCASFLLCVTSQCARQNLRYVHWSRNLSNDMMFGRDGRDWGRKTACEGQRSHGDENCHIPKRWPESVRQKDQHRLMCYPKPRSVVGLLHTVDRLRSCQISPWGLLPMPRASSPARAVFCAFGPHRIIHVLTQVR